MEVVVVHDRIEMIGFAQAFGSQVDQPEALQPMCEAIDQPDTQRERAVLAHVRVDKKRTVIAQHPIRFRQHLVQRLR